MCVCACSAALPRAERRARDPPEGLPLEDPPLEGLPLARDPPEGAPLAPRAGLAPGRHRRQEGRGLV